MATKSITYCDRCKNDLTAVAGIVGRARIDQFKVPVTDSPQMFKAITADLCASCLREFTRQFMRDFPTHLPPPVPKPEANLKTPEYYEAGSVYNPNANFP